MVSNYTSVLVSNYDFALKLTNQLGAPNYQNNLFLSPASISLVMAMCYFGARRSTKDQIKQHIFGDTNVADQLVNNWVDNVMQSARGDNTGNVTLKFANRLYVNKKFQLKTAYQQQISGTFKSDVLKGDFDAGASQTTREINDWIESNTNGRIKNIIPPGTLDPLTALLVINTLYFKGAWADQFNSQLTRKYDFHSSVNTVAEVDMMHLNEKAGYFEDGDVQVLKLDYHKSSISFVAVLPKQRNGLKSLLSDLNGQTLKKYFDGVRRVKVQIDLPKFKIEQSFKLNDALEHLGISDAFSMEKADFSDMLQNGETLGLYISHVLHKAFIELDEKGTEAAAATVVKVALRTAMIDNQQPKTFVADHPFLFFITTGSGGDQMILFAGEFHAK